MNSPGELPLGTGLETEGQLPEDAWFDDPWIPFPELDDYEVALDLLP